MLFFVIPFPLISPLFHLYSLFFSFLHSHLFLLPRTSFLSSLFSSYLPSSSVFPPLFFTHLSLFLLQLSPHSAFLTFSWVEYSHKIILPSLLSSPLSSYLSSFSVFSLLFFTHLSLFLLQPSPHPASPTLSFRDNPSVTPLLFLPPVSHHLLSSSLFFTHLSLFLLQLSPHPASLTLAGRVQPQDGLPVSAAAGPVE